MKKPATQSKSSPANNRAPKLVDSHNRNFIFNPDHTYLPLVVVMSLIGGTVFLTNFINNKQNQIESQFKDLTVQFSSIKVSVDNIENLVKLRNASRWTKADMTLWCYEVEKQNPKFKCPKGYEIQTPKEEN